MTDSPFTWAQLLQFAQALLVPALLYLTRVLQKLSERLDQVEKDQIRTNTLLTMRQEQRAEDKASLEKVLEKLSATIEKLHSEMVGKKP
jgi:hypothetical protein